MALKRAAIAVAALSLALVIFSSFAAQLYQQRNFNLDYTQEPAIRLHSLASFNALTINQYCLLSITPSVSVETSTATQTALTNSTRNQIYDYITANPGLQFRAICSALCLPLGLAEYHLGVLVKSGLVSFVRDGRYKRFFVAKRFSKREILAICLLRRPTSKRIIQVLLAKKESAHGKLALDISITSQALTWQMKTLANTNFILQTNDGLKTIYRLDESSVPMLRAYLTVVNYPLKSDSF